MSWRAVRWFCMGLGLCLLVGGCGSSDLSADSLPDGDSVTGICKEDSDCQDDTICYVPPGSVDGWGICVPEDPGDGDRETDLDEPSDGDIPDGDLLPGDGEKEMEIPSDEDHLIDGDRDLDEDLDAESDFDFDVTESDPDEIDWGDYECVDPASIDYTCTMGVEETCPGGWCLLGICIGPVVNQDRWATCGDGLCDPCETPDGCPADCASHPAFSGEKDYSNETTITVWLHGFSNKGNADLEQTVYGATRSCSGILDMMRQNGIDRPCGDTPAGASSPQGFFKIEYYGAIPDPIYTNDEIEEIEQYPYDGPETLHRYGLIVAKYLRHKLEETGATHINLTCHSMGCYVTRYVIENNLENLAAENRFVRWFTSAGVIAGARLARLYGNPVVQGIGGLLGVVGLQLADFIIMHPDIAMDEVAAWDHKLYEANSPYFGGMLIHHGCATDPRIEEALGIQLLDIDNPTHEPNDGIMYTFDEFFHDQPEALAFKTPSGQTVRPTHTTFYIDHMNYPDTEGAGLLATAGLFHDRKVRITLDEVHLFSDRENHSLGDGENGVAPAEISFESSVRFNPYIQETFGKNVVVHESKVEHRAPDLYIHPDGVEVQAPGLVIFEGPVFDAMTQLTLSMKLLEVDFYERYNVNEWRFDPHEELVSFSGQVPLTDHTFEANSPYAKIVLRVEMFELF